MSATPWQIANRTRLAEYGRLRRQLDPDIAKRGNLRRYGMVSAEVGVQLLKRLEASTGN